MMFDWEGTGTSVLELNPDTALRQLDIEINNRKYQYYDSYSNEESIDEKHKDNYFNSMYLARATALDVLSSYTSYDLWIDEVLPNNPYIYGGKVNVLSTTENRYDFNHQDSKFLEDLFDDRVEALSKQVTRKKNGQVVTKWVRRGQFTTVKTGADWSHEFSSVEQFMREVTKWAENLPEDTDELVGWAMLKYSELLVSHPGKPNAYYMQSIKNDRIKRWEKKKVEEVYMNYTDDGELIEKEGQSDTYAFQIIDWFSDLTPYGQDAIHESFTFIMANPEKELPERIKRRVRKIKSRPELR